MALNKFKPFIGRKIQLNVMNKEEMKEYLRQEHCYGNRNDVEVSKRDRKSIFLTIKNEDQKEIGVIKVQNLNEREGYAQISIPNESWETRYGNEALHQFVKYCEENHVFDMLILDGKNSIVCSYKNERPQKFDFKEKGILQIK